MNHGGRGLQLAALGRGRTSRAAPPTGSQPAWSLAGPSLLLLSSPWAWASERAAALRDYFAHGPGRGLVIDGPVFLIVGGLSILFLVASLLLLQSLVPSRPVGEQGLAAPKDRRELRPLYGDPEAKDTTLPDAAGVARRKHAARIPEIDVALASVVRAGLGEPRVVRLTGRYAVVRLMGCHGCTPTHGTPPREDAECRFEQQFLIDAFQSTFGRATTVREPRCRGRGAPWCEYEVGY